MENDYTYINAMYVKRVHRKRELENVCRQLVITRRIRTTVEPRVRIVKDPPTNKNPPYTRNCEKVHLFILIHGAYNTRSCKTALYTVKLKKKTNVYSSKFAFKVNLIIGHYSKW